MGTVNFTALGVTGSPVTVSVSQQGVGFSLNVKTGSDSGGTPVTITGTNFSGLQSVLFGATPATIQSATSTKIYVTSPPGSGKVDVTVNSTTGSETLSDAFTYTEEKSVPLAAWPAALALGAAAVVALRKRKRS
ncbi:MAG: IPT/TIG domain-containing protein [Candidatus Hydrogenedentes bacterium]|nr:IPT/TIG domain-containing protein [Candidatus Hydrogenedentota bacterium]